MTEPRKRAVPAHLAGSPLTDGLRLIGHYARAHIGPFLTSCTGSVVYAAGTVGSAFALGWAVDEALVPHFEGADSRHWAAAALLIGVLVGLVAGGIAYLFTGIAVIRRCRPAGERANHIAMHSVLPMIATVVPGIVATLGV